MVDLPKSRRELSVPNRVVDQESVCHFDVNETLDHKSCTDYVLTSNSERTVAFNLLDIDINLSDHLPLLSIYLVSGLSQSL
jgi:hypothetical protein